jgi:hypothetical protein
LDLILTIARTFGVPAENMVKTLFIFTDMQFNQAHHQQTVSWNNDSDDEEAVVNLTQEDTLYNNAKAKYAAAGYELPKIVFWNLRATEKNAFPVTTSQHGTAFVSGFSSDLLKVFLDGIDFEPLNILTQLLSKYEVVVDPSEI